MKEKENKNNIQYYFDKNRYFDMLKSTKVYKDIYWSKECFFSILFTILILFLFKNMPIESFTKELSDKLSDLLGVLIGSIFGMLGFVIGGLALIVGSIGKKMIDKINNDEKFNSLLGIIFRFYFVGSILALTALTQIFTYIILMFPSEFEKKLTCFLIFINSYLFIFSLISSVMLMGSCIRLMILQYYYEEEDKDK